jgi:hypothetical protein
MKNLILIPFVCLLFASLGWGRESTAPRLQQVKHRAHHATRHHGHKATRHHAARHHHAA